MNVQETIILGVMSGVLTSAFLFLCVTVFNQIILPWYREISYRGMDIGGTWELKTDHGPVIDYVNMDITQKEQNVSGTITVIKLHKDTENQITKVLTLKGVFQDGTLMYIANDKDRRRHSFQTGLFKIGTGGISLDGITTWLDAVKGEVMTRPNTFIRKNA